MSRTGQGGFSGLLEVVFPKQSEKCRSKMHGLKPKTPETVLGVRCLSQLRLMVQCSSRCDGNCISQNDAEHVKENTNIKL